MGNEPDEKAELAELLDAATNTIEEGFVVLDGQSHVAAWNPAAGEVSGYHRADMLGRALPSDFYQLLPPAPGSVDGPHGAGGERPLLVHLQHRLGHTLPAMLRLVPLRNALGRRFGTVLRFHPTEEVDALPHGASDEDSLEHHVESTQAEMAQRLDEAWQEWSTEGVAFGVLWITVDQAEMLRKTHGRDACEAMLAIVERTLAHALRPAELLGRWGSHEFLVLCHERTAEMLLLHARHVSELARGADFRWWGDRVELTVSIGAAQAGVAQGEEGPRLRTLIEQAQRAMHTARIAGGNTAVLKQDGASSAESGGQACSRS